MQIKCPGCGKYLEIIEEYYGRKIECTNCGQRLQIDPPVPVSLPKKSSLEQMPIPMIKPETRIKHSMSDEYQECEFCGEAIKRTAIKCKHCHEFLIPENNSSLRVEIEQTAPPQAHKGRRVLIALGIILLSFVLCASLSPLLDLLIIIIGACWILSIINERWIICFNGRCGYKGKAKMKQNGSVLLLIILLLLGVIPGLLYLAFGFRKEYLCPQCNNKIS